MGKVFVVSKHHFNSILNEYKINDETVENFKDNAFISINDFTGSFSDHLLEKDHDNYISLNFDDITEEEQKSPTNKGQTKVISDEDIEKIVEFVKKHKDKTFIVHCAAGISRSGAVGLFINDYFGYDYKEFKKDNPYIIPNRYIYNKLIEKSKK